MCTIFFIFISFYLKALFLLKKCVHSLLILRLFLIFIFYIQILCPFFFMSTFFNIQFYVQSLLLLSFILKPYFFYFQILKAYFSYLKTNFFKILCPFFPMSTSFFKTFIFSTIILWPFSIISILLFKTHIHLLNFYVHSLLCLPFHSKPIFIFYSYLFLLSIQKTQKNFPTNRCHSQSLCKHKLCTKIE